MTLKNITPLFFSSPEHNVLKGSFKDHLVSVVRCLSCAVRLPSCVANNFFKHLLLPNRWANLTKFGSNVPWEVLFKNCSQNLIPSKNSVAIVTKWNSLSNSLKFFSSGTAGPDFEIISLECSLGDPFQKLFAKF